MFRKDGRKICIFLQNSVPVFQKNDTIHMRGYFLFNKALLN